MKIMIVSDAWFPQTNGVITTLAQTAASLGRFGYEVRMVTPRDFTTIPCPSYPEIRVAVFPYRPMARRIAIFRPHALHIATEGPLGWAPITRSFPSTFTPDCRFQSASPTAYCAGSTAQVSAAWSVHRP
jgi:hypothetical protein